MAIHILEGGQDVCLFGVHEESLEFLGCEFYATVTRLVQSHLPNDPASV